MIALFAAVVAAGSAGAGAVPLAVFQPVVDGSAVVVAIRDGAAGRALTVECLDPCPPQRQFSEPFDDTPLGLFQPFDREPIVVAVAAGGSVYRVRAYRIVAAGTSRVLDAASRAAPGFAVAADGALTITTTERANRVPPGHDRRVTWTWRGDAFVRR